MCHFHLSQHHVGRIHLQKMRVVLFLVMLELIVSTVTGDVGVDVFTPGEVGFPCIRIPYITQTSSGVLVALAECRQWTGDGCNPSKDSDYQIEGGSTYVCSKRSTDDGQTWSNFTFPLGKADPHAIPTLCFSRGDECALSR